MGLNPRMNTITSGEALFNGEDLLKASNRRLREIRGNDIAMIFQDPMTSLNPVHSIGAQLVEAILLHRDVSKKQARARVGSSCSRPSGSRGRSGGSTTTRTSSRAACASA